MQAHTTDNSLKSHKQIEVLNRTSPTASPLCAPLRLRLGHAPGPVWLSVLTSPWRWLLGECLVPPSGPVSNKLLYSNFFCGLLLNHNSLSGTLGSNKQMLIERNHNSEWNMFIHIARMVIFSFQIFFKFQFKKWSCPLFIRSLTYLHIVEY